MRDYTLQSSPFLLLFTLKLINSWLIAFFDSTRMHWHLYQGGQNFSVNGQKVNILGFAHHIFYFNSWLNSAIVAQNQPWKICKWVDMAVFL